jgi:hypothetical protein
MSETLTGLNSNEHNAAPSGSGPDSIFTANTTGNTSNLFPGSNTTHSSEDAQTTATSINNTVALHNDLYSNVRTGVVQDIRTFLSKPIILSAGTFATTDSFTSGPVAGDYFPSKPLFATPLWKNKMSGNYLLKGTAVFTIQVNANRFQQGRYILNVVLSGGSICGSQAGGNMVTTAHTLTLTQITQLPHVQIDLATDTAGELRVPLTTATGWTGFVNSPVYNDVGVWQIQPYSPLVAPTGSTVAEYTLWLHFEDVEVAWPLVPQSRNSIKSKVTRKPKISVESSEMSGPVSSTFNKISTASNILAGVPIMSSVATTVGWASDIVAQVASVFGWSKPTILDPTTIVSRYIFPKYNNADTHDTSTRMAVSDSAKVEGLPGFSCNDIDELAISHLATISAYYTQFNWTTSNATGTNLLSQKITPRNFIYQATSLTVGFTSPTPLAWIANFFTLWRGSIIFSFKLVKTEFHSGRLVVVFYPYDYTATGAHLGDPTLADTAYLHRDIIDIRNGNEFTFTVPYTAWQSYKPTLGVNTSVIGKLLVYVVNPLVAPSSVATTVPVLIEVAGGPDIEFAFPRTVSESPCIGIQPMSGGSKSKEIVSAVIGGSSVVESIAPAKFCIGERVLSLRQLLKRFNPLQLNSTGAADTFFQFVPFSMFYKQQRSDTHALASPENRADILSQVAFAFTYFRGSLRYKIVDYAPSDNKLMAVRNIYLGATTFNWAFNNFEYSAASITSVTEFGNGDNNTFTYGGITAGLEVEFPYYCVTPMSPVADMFSNYVARAAALPCYSYNFNGFVPQSCAEMWSNAAVTGIRMFRAAGEDFELGMFMSTPLMDSWNQTS